MSGLIQDLRYALRQLHKNPGFTAVAVITMALGIGANTTVFSNINAMLVRPFPFYRLDRLVTIWETVPKQNADRVSAAPANFRDWSEQSGAFQQLAAMQGWDANLTDSHVAEHVEGYRVSANFFQTLGMPMFLGRDIGAADFQQGAAPVAVINYGFWQQHLGADRGIVGRQLQLNGQSLTVVGITAQDFDFPPGAQIWTPLDLSDAQKADRQAHSLMVFGRLKDGVSIPQAQADLQTAAARLAKQYPDTNGGREVRVVDMVDDLAAGSKQFLGVLMGAALFVLLLCCANVANLQLARASSRQREVALRTALGAGRWRIGRQFLVEGVVLAVLGSAGALLLSSWALKLVRNNLPPFIVAHVAGLRHLEVDTRVFLFTLAIAVLTGIITGLAPTLQLARPHLSDTLKESGRGLSTGGNRLRTLLVISEVALSLVLLVGAGTMVAGFRKMVAMDMGFDRSHVLTFEVSLPKDKYRDQDRIRGYYDQVLHRIQSLPGVESAACLSSLPSGWAWNWTAFEIEGKPASTAAETPSAIQQVVSPGFFSALRVPLRQGRLISEQDGKDALEVAVLSEDMAKRNWPGESPIGKHIRMGQPIALAPWRTVVGVVGDVSPSPFDHDPAPTMYVPITQHPDLSSAFAVRVSGDPLALASSLNVQLRSVDADQPAYDIRSLEQVVSDGLSGVQTSAYLMFVFGACALMLASAGIFAVMTYSVAQRTREIGVRMALGANRADVLRMVLGSALKMSAIGLAIGLALAFFMTQALSRVLFGMVQINIGMFAGLAVLLVVVAGFAAYMPARWAMRVDPMVALRYE